MGCGSSSSFRVMKSTVPVARIEMLDTDGRSVFGAIEQEVVRYS